MTPVPSPCPPDDQLGRILATSEPPPFALLYRPDSGARNTVDVLTGEVSFPETLAEIPLEGRSGDGVGEAGTNDTLVLMPYRQLAERDLTAPDDGEPLITMSVAEQGTLPLDEVLARIPDVPTTLTNGRFDVSDESHAETVRRIVSEEIGAGAGANFVLKRTYRADLTSYSPHTALSLFRRLLEREEGAYWTFLIHTGERTLVGATPERHVSMENGSAVMNPVSGTYRYPSTGPTLRGVTEFLADRKEIDELFMVVDEELKMMSRICPSGGKVTGPYLKEMARLAHTEYFIEGHTSRDVREILRETMFAPTVTGSPLENAARVISRHEPGGRGYYSGVAALVGRDSCGERTLDSALLIRTADIDATGHLRIGVGSTLVRHSDPSSEVGETRSKASGLLDALEENSSPRFRQHPEVRAELAKRNTRMSGFWLRDAENRRTRIPELAGLRTLVVDAEDTFTAMIAQQLAALGLDVTVRRFDEEYSFDDHDLVVMGPGPGDPRATDDPRITHLDTAITRLLDERRPFLAVCLSHQVLSLRLGLDLLPREVPNQGVQREIDLYGARERVGFYNTYSAHSTEDKRDLAGVGPVEISRNAADTEVHGLRGPRFATMQFHAESVITVDGPRITAENVRAVMGT